MPDLEKRDARRMAMMSEWEKREVKVSTDDKQALMEHIEAINTIVEKYPRYKDTKCHVLTTMYRVKNSANELAKWIKCLLVEETQP